ncbi:MAG: hypothetical protein WC993_04930 [Methanoculleus sp.]|nr:hypothetical protein [Methanomicrobiales archaeon]
MKSLDASGEALARNRCRAVSTVEVSLVSFPDHHAEALAYTCPHGFLRIIRG